MGRGGGSCHYAEGIYKYLGYLAVVRECNCHQGGVNNQQKLNEFLENLHSF